MEIKNEPQPQNKVEVKLKLCETPPANHKFSMCDINFGSVYYFPYYFDQPNANEVLKFEGDVIKASNGVEGYIVIDGKLMK